MDCDEIDVAGTGLAWLNFDSNGNGVLDDGDDHVSVSRGYTAIDLGDAAGVSQAGENVVTIENNTGLVEADFVFV